MTDQLSEYVCPQSPIQSLRGVVPCILSQFYMLGEITAYEIGGVHCSSVILNVHVDKHVLKTGTVSYMNASLEIANSLCN